MNDTTKNHDDLAHIETMNAEQLREELRAAVAFHRVCLVSNWHEKKQILDENKMLRSQLDSGIDALKAAVNITKQADKLNANLNMWKRTSYALVFILGFVAYWLMKGVAA